MSPAKISAATAAVSDFMSNDFGLAPVHVARQLESIFESHGVTEIPVSSMRGMVKVARSAASGGIVMAESVFELIKILDANNIKYEIKDNEVRYYYCYY